MRPAQNKDKDQDQQHDQNKTEIETRLNQVNTVPGQRPNQLILMITFKSHALCPIFKSLHSLNLITSPMSKQGKTKT